MKGLTQVDQRKLALLDWYREMGADEVLGAQPVDWLGGPARVPGADLMSEFVALRQEGAGETVSAPRSDRGTAAPFSAPAGAIGRAEPKVPERGITPSQGSGPATGVGAGRSFQTPPPDASLAAANEAVSSASTLSALHEKLMAFEGCGLKATAKNTCFYRGAPAAKVMIIGEAPGRDEDLEGRPFVGRAGQLLDLMLRAIDLGEETVHITNVVYWRPPGNRTPTPQEARVCRPFLEQQVRLVDPEIVVLLGGAAAKNLFETTQGIMRLRGKWREVLLGGEKRKVLATLHPAYLLRTPEAKRLAWRDFLAVKAGLSGLV